RAADPQPAPEPCAAAGPALVSAHLLPASAGDSPPGGTAPRQRPPPSPPPSARLIDDRAAWRPAEPIRGALFMTRIHPCPAHARPRAAFAVKHTRRRWALAHAALLASLSSGVLAADHSHHQLAPTVITGVAPAAGVTVATDPKIPRQPVPASDAGDYLQTIPGFSAVRGGGSNADPVFRGLFG